jgi:hypothetical protein
MLCCWPKAKTVVLAWLALADPPATCHCAVFDAPCLSYIKVRSESIHKEREAKLTSSCGCLCNSDPEKQRGGIHQFPSGDRDKIVFDISDHIFYCPMDLFLIGLLDW